MHNQHLFAQRIWKVCPSLTLTHKSAKYQRVVNILFIHSVRLLYDQRSVGLRGYGGELTANFFHHFHA